ncbi:cyclic GMP-AMP synthase-like [Mercenaria mercenaria]|uniref:cyclic GMP-AMP synthase-like n=1 Tax=Mercenaria mercenaria TaxID=6596 RepID=UPI00234F0D66|nr:cyclic GMP-AMP synthase-like [Mercenaria mercenaria]
MACSSCGESRFANSAQLGCHVSKNHAELSCGCNKKFMDEESLENHKSQMQDNLKKCPCSGCCRSFDTANGMHQHKRSTGHWAPGERENAQKETGRVYCDDRCGRSFKTASACADHRKDIAAKYGIDDKSCRGCEKSFPNKDRLDQHRKDTGHSSKTSSRAKEYLDNFHKSKVAVNKDDKKSSVQIVDGTLRQIMDHVRKSEGGHIYCPNAVKAGSYPVKTKIGKADEFDTNIPCNITPENVNTRGKFYYGYQPLDKKMGNSNNMNVDMKLKAVPGGKEIPMGFATVAVKDGSVPDKLTYNGNLVPREVKKDLHGKIKTAVKELGLKNVDVSRNAHGPALTLNIHQGPGRHDINVDITPSVACNVPITDNGWPRPDTRIAFKDGVIDDIKKVGTHLVPKSDDKWALSCSKAEKVMLSKIDDGNGCRREVNKIMKKHVQNCTSRAEDGLPGVSSHIIKHQILWSAEKHPDQSYWHHGNIDNCLIDTMGDMATALGQGKLPNYFNTSDNILRGKDRGVLRELGSYFKDERKKLLHM